ncbi:hypothetical protein GCK32_004268 [Trichostrongylus colubriformis]|uniref:Uncharacterized protein n=1 Tax=Trichostrongylus colubriformis TaxID=6319 RepID=A0AAN8FBK6_TRICO
MCDETTVHAAFEVISKLANTCATALKLVKQLYEELAVAVEKAKKSEADSQKVIESLEAKIASLIAERDSFKNRPAAAEDQKVWKNAIESVALLAASISLLIKAEVEWKQKEQEYKRAAVENSAEIEELKQELEWKTREIARLEELCDETVQSEAKLREDLFTAERERDQLKEQLEPTGAPEDPIRELHRPKGDF